MAILITMREPGGRTFPLAIENDRFADPDAVPVESELSTGHLWVVPGFADAHAHLALAAIDDARGIDDETVAANVERHAAAQVAGGVLLALDKGSPSRSALRALDLPAVTRPELEMAGRMIAPPGGYYPGFAVENDDPVPPVVAEAAPPARWVKLVGDWPRRGFGPVANWEENALRRAVEAAHARGVRVAVHTMAPAGIGPAIAAGVDSVEHGLFLTVDDLAVLAARGGAWVPTVLAVEAIVEMLGPDSGGGRLLRRGLDNVRELLPEAERLGVTVLAGTDLAVPHGHVAREALRLIDFGLSAASALAALTTSAWRYTGREVGFRPGLPADAVFLHADPLEEPSALLHPAIVLRRGRVVRP